MCKLVGITPATNEPVFSSPFRHVDHLCRHVTIPYDGVIEYCTSEFPYVAYINPTDENVNCAWLAIDPRPFPGRFGEEDGFIPWNGDSVGLPDSPTLFADIRLRNVFAIQDANTGERLVDLRSLNHPEPWWRLVHERQRVCVVACDIWSLREANHSREPAAILEKAGARAAALKVGIYITEDGVGSSVEERA